MALSDLTTRQRQPRVEEPAFLAFVRRQRCCVCSAFPPNHAAHIRRACLELGKRYTGKGERPDDRFAVPLCAGCHQHGPGAQHKGAEEKFWKRVGIDPFKVASDLYIEFEGWKNERAQMSGMPKTIRGTQRPASAHETQAPYSRRRQAFRTQYPRAPHGGVPPRQDRRGRKTIQVRGTKTMSDKKIGTKEQQLRDMREQQTKPVGAAKAAIESVAAKLPKTSGKKPVKRKKGSKP